MHNRRILIGITGSISAYKAVEISRELVRKGHTVDVILTEGALGFLGPFAFSGLVNGDVFLPESEHAIPFAHLEIPKRTDILVIVPATANTLNKIANGVADNLLTAVTLTAQCRKIICPAMNFRMWQSDIVQESVKKLEEQGWIVVYPESGELACGDTGEGRLADTKAILDTIESQIRFSTILKEKRILIASGPTREWIDDVRFISNASSGKMGLALAAEAKSSGAEVTYVTGPANYIYKAADKLIKVETAAQMLEALKNEFLECDALIMAAAVSDFTVEKTAGKIKKNDRDELRLILKRNPDILLELSKIKKDQVVVGFALETENLIENARKKLEEKKLDAIVANTPETFDSDFVNARIIFSSGKTVDIEKNIPKRQAAGIIIEEIGKIFVEKSVEKHEQL